MLLYFLILLLLFSFYFFDIFGNRSLLIIFFSIDNIPDPVMMIHIIIARYSRSNSYPPINPFGNFTVIIAPIIFMANNIAEILVKTPNKITKPPITSKRPITIAKSGGNPILVNEFCVPGISESLGRPCAIKPIPAIILNGRGAKSKMFFVC